MKIVNIEQNSEKWLELRKGKITGSKLKDLIVKRGNGKKVGFYQLIADRLAIDDQSIDGIDRGHDLEEAALEHFENITGKRLNKDCGMWLSDLDDNIAISPDAAVVPETPDIYTEAVEAKCLGSARHIEAVLTNKLPNDYSDQALQYFVVNEHLETLYFVFYDPRVAAKPMHIIEIKREEVASDVEYYREYETKLLQEVDEAVAQLAF